MNQTILVIDDDASIISIFEFILQQAGYKTLAAQSQNEGLRLAKDSPGIDLVFLDINFSEPAHLSAIEDLFRINPALLIIVMSSDFVTDAIGKIFELGVYGIIYKPFDVEEVLETISKILKPVQSNAE